MTIDRQQLRRFPLFQDYSEEVLERSVLPHLVQLDVQAGETICREREPGDCCFFLCEGNIRVQMSLSSGKQEQVGSLEAGALFGQVTLLDNGTRSATCIASSPCRILTLQRATFLQLNEEGHRFAFDLIREIGASLARQIRQATENLSAMSETRVEDPSAAAERLKRFIQGDEQTPASDILGKSSLMGLKLRKIEL